MKATVIRLNENSRALFDKMKFPEIPEEANYVAFTEDGNAIFLEKLEMTAAVAFPKHTFMSYYDVENLGIE